MRQNRLAYLLAAVTMIGPFAIDTYLPSFPAMARDLHASELEIQQTLTAYLIPFAFMMLWHGSLSDAWGRRRIVLAGLGVFMVSSIVCALATDVAMLWCGRMLQGLSAGVGIVVGRAIVRDLFDGPAAQRMLSKIMMLFSIAPAVAPMIGGWILLLADWRGIFWFLALFSALMLGVCRRWLPETLAPEKRQPLYWKGLARAYCDVLLHRRFRRLAVAGALNFNAIFMYVLAAPVFLIQHLKLSPQAFATMFAPVVGGMALGAYLSGQAAGRISPIRTIFGGYALMALAALLNLAVNLTMAPGIPWSIAPLPLFSIGMAMAMPSMQLLALDLFPERRGLASSCYGAVQTGLNAFSAALIVPILWSSTLWLAGGMVVATTLGAAMFMLRNQTTSLTSAPPRD
ncbi:MAG TPA: multidrug effflux MFS transporter [Rhodocyclaceae bacterium]|nr:multidrug effflux MFS transporter [Rhodocyclaceae bacterium]